MDLRTELIQHIREVPDFPIPGILFKDISPLFLNPKLIAQCTDALTKPWLNHRVNKVIGIDSRGFLFGPQIATGLSSGFVIVRKKGKLPPETREVSYDLEYGSATIETVEHAIQPGDRIVIHDDLLATGGTAAAAADLATQMGANVVGFSFLISLSYLPGRNRLNPYTADVHTLIDFDK